MPTRMRMISTIAKTCKVRFYVSNAGARGGGLLYTFHQHPCVTRCVEYKACARIQGLAVRTPGGLGRQAPFAECMSWRR